MANYTSVEICAGAGGQAIGLEQAGFEHLALVEIEERACQTLSLNRPNWNVINSDLKLFDATPYRGVDLLAGGVPCQPFSTGGKQLGADDERDLFPEIPRLVRECSPKAVMIENVPGLLSLAFEKYRNEFAEEMDSLGYNGYWQLLNACDYGVPQLRPRVIFVAIMKEYARFFRWPAPDIFNKQTVGDVLFNEMVSRGWQGAYEWRYKANAIAPTLVGGSKKHGGPDLGPTRSKKAWEQLNVDGRGIADEPPAPDFVGMPRLTVKMTALLQGFPPDWEFAGKKTPAYRQVGNAFPPPVAKAVGDSIKKALDAALSKKRGIA